MRGATLYLNDALYDREREQRRRARRAFAGAAVIALLGLGAALHTPPAPPPKIVTVERRVPVEIECSVMRQETVVTPPIVETHIVTGPVKLLPFAWPTVERPDPQRPARHLCVSPKRINFYGESTTDRVTVSNAGDVPMRVTQVTFPARSGFVINADDCADRTLGAGERCTISVELRDRNAKPMAVLVANDRGDDEVFRLSASPASPASPRAAW